MQPAAQPTRSGVLAHVVTGGNWDTTILLINTALFVAGYLSPQLGLLEQGASLPAPLMQGQWWRLITAGFLHGGILHILMNSWVLFDLGADRSADGVIEYTGSAFCGGLDHNLLVTYYSVGDNVQRIRLSPDR